jgi:hypothetical protein
MLTSPKAILMQSNQTKAIRPAKATKAVKAEARQAATTTCPERNTPVSEPSGSSHSTPESSCERLRTF